MLCCTVLCCALLCVAVVCSYWGRRAFERHFKEWRHVNGMKALGIPNNKDFFEVTQIADAQQLWKTIQVGLGLFYSGCCVVWVGGGEAVIMSGSSHSVCVWTFSRTWGLG